MSLPPVTVLAVPVFLLGDARADLESAPGWLSKLRIGLDHRYVICPVPTTKFCH